MAVHGTRSGREGVWLAEGGVDGLWRMPVETEWTSAREERGGRHIGTTLPAADITLGFHVAADDVLAAEDLLDGMFTYGLDQWDPDDKLARIEVNAGRDFRWREVQLHEEPELDIDIDPDVTEYLGALYSLRAGNPAWQSKTEVTHWETSGTSGAGEIEVSNPTDLPMFQTWVLTRGTWTVPDVSWTGPKRRRKPGGEHADRAITLRPITEVHGGARINLDPMRLMVESWSGTNLLGEVGGGYRFIYEIPPHTPKTMLPISVTDAPAGGARAELHQPRQWTKPWGRW